MGAKSFAILTSPTISITGGTAVNFADTGLSISNGVQVANSGQSDPRLQETVTLRTRRPSFKNGKFLSKDKRTAVFSKPFVHADGTISYGVVRQEIELHPDVPNFAAEHLKLRQYGCQLPVDAELETFNAAGTIG